MAITLQPLDEIIAARRSLHGGRRGAPIRLDDGTREGIALNKACVVMLSAIMQSYIEDVFIDCSAKAFGRQLNGQELANYRKTWNRWGNPSPSNIVGLFRRLGIDDVFLGLSWQRQSTAMIRNKLDRRNQVRNCIAHGADLRVDNRPYALRLDEIGRWRAFAEQFGQRFQQVAEAKIR